jgi:hypothetical protein
LRFRRLRLIKKAVLGILDKDGPGYPKLRDLGEDVWMQMRVEGGNKFQPATTDKGLKLYSMSVGTAWDIAMLVNFSITAEKGMI